MPERIEREALVKAARNLERLLARRRRVLVTLRGLDDELRAERKLLRDLSAPLLADVYAPLAEEGHVPGTLSKIVLDAATGPTFADEPDVHS
jgi:hypothetical protein